MQIFGFGTKKDKSIQQDIISKIAENVNAEKAIITYILQQSQEDKISLAKKDNVTYICFKNEDISNFLSEWYTLLQLHQHKKLSQKMYEIFIKSQFEENKITDDARKLGNTKENQDDAENLDDLEVYL